MNSASLPQELNQPLPRYAKAKTSFIVRYTLLSLSLLGFAAFESYTTFMTCHDHAILKEHGVVADARVTDLSIRHIKSSSYYDVSYEFRPPGGTDTTTPQKATRQTLKENFEQLNIGQPVPVLYDPANPARSDLDFKDVIHTTDPYLALPVILSLIWGIFGGSWLFIVVWALAIYSKEKKLIRYGNIAPATILNSETIQGRYPSVTVTYEFKDNHGALVKSVQKGLPTEKQRKSKKVQAAWDRVMTSPVVLYDPEDSSKSMLYGTGSVICYLPLR